MTARTSRSRQCRECSRWFPDLGPGKRPAPAGYCSRECHAASKPVPAAPARNAGPRRTVAKQTRKAISPAAPAQRASVKDRACIVCRGHAGHCHPAHLIDRSLTTVGQDDPRAVVPLCPEHHRLYDDPIGTGGLDLLPFLEPGFRSELAYAVERVGLLTTLRRVTNDRAAFARSPLDP